MAMDSRTESKRYEIVMLPWLAFSHISRFLGFTKRLTSHNFHIIICSSQINLHYISKNLPHKYSQSIQLVELNFPPSSDLPLHYHTTNGLPPHLKNTLVDDYEKCAPGFAAILETIRPDLVIYDINQWWASEAASSLNIPSIQFLSGCVALYSMAAHMSIKPTETYPFPEIFPQNRLTRNTETNEDMSKAGERFMKSMKMSRDIVLVKSTMELEGKYIDYLSHTLGKSVLPVGPLVQESSQEDVDGHVGIVSWLDKKHDSSVVFVSFGSEYFLSDEEIEDIAYGLELSQVSFIWVIRIHDRMKANTIEQLLPHGYLERLGDRGMVIEKWVPQAKILSHSSTGAFISHCGWGSTMESVRYGVPIIAMPMQYDQPFNARLVEAVGVGIEVGRDGDGRLKREDMAEVVRKVVVEDGGESVRKKAKELGEIMRGKMDEEVDGVVIDNLIKLCDTTRKSGL